MEVVQSNDFEPDYNSGVLVHRSIVEELNGGLRKLALAKVAHLQQKMELRKGIHRLEWEHRRLKLCVL